MSENAFTLEDITEMAKRVRTWNDGMDSGVIYPDGQKTAYTGYIKPKWYSLDVLVLNVARYTRHNGDSLVSTYSAIVSYSDKIIANYKGQDANQPFDVANKSNLQVESEKQKVLLELRGLISDTPQESSIVKQLTLDEVLSVIKRFDECTCSAGYSFVKYNGRIKIGGQSPDLELAIRQRYASKQEFNRKIILTIYVRGNVVYATEDGDTKEEILDAADKRIVALKNDKKERSQREKLESMKSAILRRKEVEKK